MVSICTHKEGISKSTKSHTQKNKTKWKKEDQKLCLHMKKSNPLLIFSSYDQISPGLGAPCLFPLDLTPQSTFNHTQIDPSSLFLFIYIFPYTSHLLIGGFQTFPIPIHFTPALFTSTPLSTCPTGHPLPIPSPH